MRHHHGAIFIDGHHVGTTLTTVHRGPSEHQQTQQNAVQTQQNSVQASATPSQGFGGGDTSYDMPRHARAFIDAIGRSETDFGHTEAYTNKYNLPKNNANVRKYGEAGADYGFFQMNEKDVNDAINKYGMDPDVARHLAGGMGVLGRPSTREQQTEAVNEYIKARWPQQYNRLVNYGDYEGMRQAAKGTWFGLKDRPSDARKEYEKILGETQ